MTSSVPRPEVISKLQRAGASSLAMLAGMQLDVFTPLKDSPKTLEQVAEAIEVSPRKLRPLMHALVVAGLLNIDDGLFRNTSEADHFLVKGNPAYMGGMSSLLSFQWSAMLNSAESIKTGVPQSKIDFSVMSEEELEAILRGLQAGAMAAGRELAEKHDFSSYRTLADIGGGSGGLAIAISEAYPHIKATVVDLPNVTPVTLRIVEEEGASERVGVIAEDAVEGPLTGSYDVIVMRAFLQVLSPEDAVRALKNMWNAMTPGGAVHIIGSALDNSRLSPVSSVGFSLFSVNIYDEGQSYTEQEHRDWLAEAGFEGFELTPMRAEMTLISARKPV
ncbi:MAG: methyltransferase [Chloroflexi bacterium]|nr:methyltransferase [Chloroflexota bacterium]